MGYSCSDFTDSILDALKIDVPEESSDCPADQADLALAEIQKLQTLARLASPRPDAPAATAWARAKYRLVMVGLALGHMRQAREILRLAGAGNAADYAARALKSAEGAERHAKRLLGEAKAAEAAAESAARAAGWRRYTKDEKAAGFCPFQNSEGTQSDAPTWADLCAREGIAAS